jgi:hypothetical protein
VFVLKSIANQTVELMGAARIPKRSVILEDFTREENYDEMGTFAVARVG